MRFLLRFLPAVAALTLTAAPAARWRLQYYYDMDTSTLSILDLQFPSAEKGMAVGQVHEPRRNRPVALVTTDGGKTWTESPAPGQPLALQFLNENQGWLVTKDTVWQTRDFGRNWKKLAKLPGVARVFFRDPQSGWAVGARKSVLLTTDGGEHWTPLPAAELPKSARDNTAYNWVAFANEQLGLIAGHGKPPRRERPAELPDWMDPASRPREWPATTILLETRDGGKTWSPSETSMFGEVTRVRLGSDGRGLALIEFFNQFDWPSEVFQLDWRTGKTSRVFRSKDRAVTDIAVLPNGRVYLAAIELSGTLAHGPVPGKLKILESDDLANWREMDVDYRAVAGRAVLAAAGPGLVWAATDTGMILKLEPQ